MSLSTEEFAELTSSVKSAILMDGPNKRRSDRKPYKGRVEVIPYSENGPATPILVSVQDISPRGICVITPSLMDRGRVFVVRMPKGNRFMSLLYTVVHCQRVAARQHKIGAELACVLRGDHDHAEPLPPSLDLIRQSVLD
jgi:hypothetical protein